MSTKLNLRSLGTRKLATRASLTKLMAKSAQKQKHLAKADLRAARKSLNHAKKVAKQALRAAREAARKA